MYNLHDAHRAWTLSPFFFFSFSNRIQIPASRVSRVTCGPCTATTHVRSHPQSYPIHFIVRRFDQRTIIDLNPLRGHEGEHHITRLFRMTILRLMHRTCIYRVLRALNASAFRALSDIYNILLSKCLNIYLKMPQHLFPLRCCNLKLSRPFIKIVKELLNSWYFYLYFYKCIELRLIKRHRVASFATRQ